MSILWDQNQYATMTNTTLLNTIGSSLTICCHATMTLLQSLSMFCSRRTSFGVTFEWYGLTLQGGVPRALIGDNSSVSVCIGSTALTLNTKYHLCMTYNGSTILLYQDGVQIATTASTKVIGTDTTALIINGNANATNDTNIVEYFTGKVEDLRIYNRVLTPNEIVTVSNAQGRDAIVNGLVLNYTMTQGVSGTSIANGSSLIDTGYSQSHATIVGTPVWSESSLLQRQLL